MLLGMPVRQEEITVTFFRILLTLTKPTFLLVVVRLYDSGQAVTNDKCQIINDKCRKLPSLRTKRSGVKQSHTMSKTKTMFPADSADYADSQCLYLFREVASSFVPHKDASGEATNYKL